MAEEREGVFDIPHGGVRGDVVIASEAKQSTVPLSPARRLGHASSAPAAGPRGSPLCHTRESGYPAGRDAAAQGLRLAGAASSRNSVSVVVSWMPAFAGMTRGKRPIQAPGV
jgi:hypothetical protein